MTPRERSLAKGGAIGVLIGFAYAFYNLATSDGSIGAVPRAMSRITRELSSETEEPLDEPEERVMRCSPDHADTDELADLPAIDWPSTRFCQIRRAHWSPARDAVAVQLVAGWPPEAAVFAADGAVLWAPDHAIDIAWGAEGSVLVVRELDPSERVAALERYRWPSRERTDELVLALPSSPDRVVVSPDGAHAALAWQGLSAWGVFVVHLGEILTAREGLWTDRDTHRSGIPVFSPDGSIVIAAATEYDWWLPPRDAAPPEDDGMSNRARRLARARAGAPGGAARVGWIWVHDLASHEIRRIDVELDLPRGWGSSIDPTRDRTPELGPVRFVDERNVEVPLPDGTTRTLAL